MSWKFNPMNPSDLNVDPIEHEFFATEALGGITDALVREAIQNSLDAAEEANVGVRFYLGRTDAVTSGRYLDSLWPHAEASHHGSAILPGRGDQTGEEITAEGLLESVLRHYFHPLVEGKLEVEIVEKDGATFRLRENDLEHEIRRRNQLRHLLPLIELARWGRDPEEEAVAVLNAPDAGHAPKLTEDLFNAADVVRLRRRFDECRRLALNVRLPIEPVGDVFVVHVRESDVKPVQCGEGFFWRQGAVTQKLKDQKFLFDRSLQPS
ncbi:MAG: hypothetical protein SCM96_07220 [Acidobacteriota bacterium]|nr:hypothetical protein [Acidobacteriota bacterium]